MLGLSCIFGLIMGWSILNAQQYVTATTMMVMGNVNRIVIIIGGAVIMRESYSWLAIAGIIIAVIGSIWYGYTRSRVAYGKKKPQFLSFADGLDKLDKLEQADSLPKKICEDASDCSTSSNSDPYEGSGHQGKSLGAGGAR